MIETDLVVTDKSGKLRKHAVTLRSSEGRIEFVKSPIALKDEIKAMKGAKWDVERKIWSIDDCQRNHFQLAYLQGKKPYAWFDRPLVRHEYARPLMPHQRDLADAGLTYHYHLWAAEMGTGKTLAAQEVIERSGREWWYWVGPKSSLPNMRREFKKWSFDESIHVEFFTYDKLVDLVDGWQPLAPVPFGVVFDESSKLKTPTTQRSKAAQKLADLIRQQHGFDGYVILMSGTPSPKSPKDWWSQCEIAWPGFLREGSDKALESRLAFMVPKEFDGQFVNVRDGWKDDERKCAICGKFADDQQHDQWSPEYHPWRPSKNEVAYMFERLKGLVVIKHKKDCLSLPDKRYRTIECKPASNVLRLAEMIAGGHENAVAALTLLRELSDGFQYRDVKQGTTRCTHCTEGYVFEWFDPQYDDRHYRSIDILDPDVVQRLERREVPCPVCKGTCEMDRMVRETISIPCPKDDALRQVLDENEETGRIVVFAGFTGSIDRCVKLCHEKKWNVVRCDGRGFQVTEHDGTTVTADALDYWETHNGRVAFVAHPESGGMSLSLTAARTAVYWSNSFKPEYRIQSEDRIHRVGMDENVGCEIVDLIHLPTDQRVLEVIRENRKLELMTMGEVKECFAIAA